MPKTKPHRAIYALVSCAFACSGTDRPSPDNRLPSDGGTATAGATNGGESHVAAGSGGVSSGGGVSNGGGVSGSGGASNGGVSNGGVSGSGRLSWKAEWAQCAAAEECTTLPIKTCCGCFTTGVNQAFAADAMAYNAGFKADQCAADLGCSGPACAPDPMVACEVGQCVARPGCSERDETSCESDGKCEKYQARLCTTAAAFAYFTCGKPHGLCDGPATCRVSPNGQQVLFPDSCVPTGYTQACPSICQ